MREINSRVGIPKEAFKRLLTKKNDEIAAGIVERFKADGRIYEAIKLALDAKDSEYVAERYWID